MGCEVENPISPKEWDSALKIIDKMPNLELYDKGEFTVEAVEKKTKETADTESENPFEASSRKVKEQLNGNTSSKTSPI